MSAATVARLKITLDAIKPAVLRRIEVPFDIRFDRKRYELPRARRLRSDLEARRHPVLAYFFGDGRNVLVGCSPELFGVRPLSGWPE
jgi:hypothetical protein